jgi:hypothetical protein
MGEETIQSYRDLRVWREAMLLAELCYRHTKAFPKDALFGLTAQIVGKMLRGLIRSLQESQP